MKQGSKYSIIDDILNDVQGDHPRWGCPLVLSYCASALLYDDARDEVTVAGGDGTAVR